VATGYKREVLDNLSYYQGSILSPAYTYKKDEAGTEIGTRVAVKEKINITYYVLEQEKHYFRIPVRNTGYSLDFECLYSHYEKKETSIDCTLTAWYYS
jgi:hypothetical protein